MKKIIINGCINFIKKYNDYDDTKIAEIKYGLEGIYLTITKLIVIFTLSIILGIFKEVIIYMCIYNIIRTTSFGLHATKSWICLVSSIILFIGIPYMCITIKIPIFIKVIIGVIGIIFMFKNSPADTYKRPIVSKRRRKKLKILSTFIAVIFLIMSLIIKDNYISNSFTFALIMQNGMISPLVYKIFKLPYNNYKDYILKHPELQFN